MTTEKKSLCGFCGEVAFPNIYHPSCYTKFQERVRSEVPETYDALFTPGGPLNTFGANRINTIMAFCRIRGFRVHLTPSANMPAYANAVLESTAEYDSEYRIFGENVHAILQNRLAEHMAKLKQQPQQNKENTIMADNKNTTQSTGRADNKNTTHSTGSMLKDALIEGGLNAACKKTNQAASDMLASLLRDKGIEVADTPEGKLFLQTTAPVLLHFLCTTFNEHIPGAQKAIPLLARAENMAVTDVMIVAGDKLIDTLLPMVKTAVASVNDVVEKLPEAAAKKLREEDEMRMRQIVQGQQEATGKTL